MTRLSETQELLFNKVYESLFAMSFGEIKELDPLHANYSNFISCCKFFIDYRYDVLNGFSLTFSEDYIKIR